MRDTFETDSSFEGAAGSAARLQRRTRRALLLVGLLFLVFILLATVMRVAGAVTAGGEISVESSVKTISHTNGGVLTALLVRDGDHVAQGQELMRFDTSVSGIGSTSASQRLAQLGATRARLEAERDGSNTLRFPAELEASTDPAVHLLMTRERRLFVLRRDDRRGALSLLGERVHQLEDQIRSFEAQIDAIDHQARLIEPELAGLRKLYERQLVTISRINELERAAVQLKGSRAALTANISETRARISETREQMLNIDRTARSEAGAQLATTVAEINDQQVRRASADDTFSRSVIKAPQSGTIDKLAFTTLGSAIPPNQPILQIVPDRDELIVTARVRPADVDQLRIGQKARVTLSGLDRQTTPDVPGTLIFISPERAQDQATGETYFRIKVRLDPAHAPGPLPQLKPGMPAEVFVETGTRSILSFLIKPLLDQMRHAFREG